MIKDVLTARQLVFNVDCDVYACEFLYINVNSANGIAPDKRLMTMKLLATLCDSVVEQNRHLELPMLINIDQCFLSEKDILPAFLPNIILEILPTVVPSALNIKRIQQLKIQGFDFALNQYGLESSKIPFFKHVKIIKVDVSKITQQQLKKSIPTLKKTKCLLLAQGVQTQASYDQCKALGFDLFQGCFLERPTVVQGKQVNAAQNNALRLVSELSKNDIEVDTVSKLISHDPTLTIKILHLINCPLYQLVREVNSVKDAVVILGLNVVKQWAMIISLVSVSTRPNELFRTLLIRAKTLEIYASYQDSAHMQAGKLECFLVGLLSGVDAIFEVGMEAVVGGLQLEAHLKQALLTNDNELGVLLVNSIGVERFDSQTFERLSNQEICLLGRCQQEALVWADQVMNNL